MSQLALFFFCVCVFSMLKKSKSRLWHVVTTQELWKYIFSTRSISKFQQFIFPDSTIWIPWCSLIFHVFKVTTQQVVTFKAQDLAATRGPGWVLPSPARSVIVLHREVVRRSAVRRNLGPQRQRRMVIVLKRNAMRTSRDVYWLQRCATSGDDEWEGALKALWWWDMILDDFG